MGKGTLHYHYNGFFLHAQDGCLLSGVQNEGKAEDEVTIPVVLHPKQSESASILLQESQFLSFLNMQWRHAEYWRRYSSMQS